MSSNYIKWDAEGVEVLQENEEQRIKDVAAQFNRFQELNYKEHMHAFRGTHLKTQGCVAGKITVKDNLPEHLAQGMFAKGASYDLIMRYSSLTPKVLPDNLSAPRGIGFKIFGVKGDKIFQTPDNETQDWTMNNYSTLELRTPQDTYEIADSLERNWNNGDGFVAELKARPDADVATLGGGLPQQHMAAMVQHSQAAYRYGDYVAKLALFPVGEEQKKLRSWSVKPEDPADILSTTLADFHKNHKATYSLQVQLLQNLKEQPVDDIGVEWPADKYPFEEVAIMEFEPQISDDPKFRVFFDDHVTCNTWHSLKTHQPLGSTNRMRRVVYAESRKLRMRLNGVDEIKEPKSFKDCPIPQAVKA